MHYKTAKIIAAILLPLLTLLLAGCTVTLPYEDRAISGTLLEDAGFWKVESDNPQRQALMDGTPKYQFVSYNLGGSKYYVYADQFNLYLGNEANYQKYVSMVKNKRLCQSLDAEDWGPFWSCFEEYQKAGGK